MLLSQLIAELQSDLAAEGDIPVFVIADMNTFDYSQLEHRALMSMLPQDFVPVEGTVPEEGYAEPGSTRLVLYGSPLRVEGGQ